MEMKNEERIEMLEDARDKLGQVIDQVREAVYGTDEEIRVGAYILPHLGTWLDDDRGSSGTSCQSLIDIFEKGDDPDDDDDDGDPGDHGDDLAPYDPPETPVGRMSDTDVFAGGSDGEMPDGWVQAVVVEGSYRVGDMVRVLDEKDRPVALEVIVLNRGGFIVPEITDLDLEDDPEGLSTHPKMTLSNGKEIDLKKFQPIVLDPRTDNRPENCVQVSFGLPGVFNLGADGKYQVKIGPNRFKFATGRELKTSDVIFIDGKWKTLVKVYPIR